MTYVYTHEIIIIIKIMELLVTKFPYELLQSFPSLCFHLPVFYLSFHLYKILEHTVIYYILLPA